MTTSKTSRKRTGLFDYVGNIVDDTKEFVDDVLDRGREVDDDNRRTARRVLRPDEEKDTSEDLADLREQLEELSKTVRKLSSADSTPSQPSKSR